MTAKEHRTFSVLSRQALPGICSASGLAEVDAGWLAVCDDSPDMFLVDLEGNLKASFPISAKPPVILDGRVPKKHKRDFEAIATYHQGKQAHLIVVGSGSKLPQRSHMVLATWQDGLQSVGEMQAEKFYLSLMAQASITESQLNIEGATVFDHRMVLLNRGLNQTFSVDLKAFIAYLSGGCNGDAPHVQVQRYHLPLTNGIHTGFSGACTDLRRNRIYFSASAEDTADWVQDGAVHGSYIGWIVRPLATDGGEIHVIPVVDDAGRLLPIKIEAIGLLPQLDGKVRILALTDSDGGFSEMLVLELRNL